MIIVNGLFVQQCIGPVAHTMGIPWEMQIILYDLNINIGYSHTVGSRTMQGYIMLYIPIHEMYNLCTDCVFWIMLVAPRQTPTVALSPCGSTRWGPCKFLHIILTDVLDIFGIHILNRISSMAFFGHVYFNLYTNVSRRTRPQQRSFCMDTGAAAKSLIKWGHWNGVGHLWFPLPRGVPVALAEIPHVIEDLIKKCSRSATGTNYNFSSLDCTGSCRLHAHLTPKALQKWPHVFKLFLHAGPLGLPWFSSKVLPRVRSAGLLGAFGWLCACLGHPFGVPWNSLSDSWAPFGCVVYLLGASRPILGDPCFPLGLSLVLPCFFFCHRCQCMFSAKGGNLRWVPPERLLDDSCSLTDSLTDALIESLTDSDSEVTDPCMDLFNG